jgi:hypothetical protein
VVLTGTEYLIDLLSSESMERFQNVARMPRDVFFQLLCYLEVHGGLSSTPRISSAEKLLILLGFVTRETLRDCAERWRRSTNTISAVIDEVVSAVEEVHNGWIRPPGIATPRHIAVSARFRPYFKDCVGAIDGQSCICVEHPQKNEDIYAEEFRRLPDRYHPEVLIGVDLWCAPRRTPAAPAVAATDCTRASAAATCSPVRSARPALVVTRTPLSISCAMYALDHCKSSSEMCTSFTGLQRASRTRAAAISCTVFDCCIFAVCVTLDVVPDAECGHGEAQDLQARH